MYSVSRDERNWGMLSHLLALLGYLGIPFGSILPPLIIYLTKREQSAFIADQARESLNFQITMIIYAIISGILAIILVGILLFAVIYVAGVVLTIVAAVKASQGAHYRYPLTLRLIS